MNSSKETDNEERIKLPDIRKLLESTSDTNTQKIISTKGKIGIINDKISHNKKLMDYYENKLEELMTEIVNTEWIQIKAKTILKTDIQFVEELKNKLIDNEQKVDKITEDESIANKTTELRQEKENLEIQCKTNDKIKEKLYSEFQELKQDI